MAALSPADGTVSVHVLRALVFGAQHYGIELTEIAERLALPDGTLALELLADGDARVPASVVLRLWQELPKWAGDEAGFGLRLAERAASMGFTAAWWIVQNSASWREGLERALAYQRLLHDHNRSRVVFDGEGARYIHEVGEAAFRAPSAALEFGMAMLVYLARRSTGTEVFPERVCFRHRAPPSLELHSRVFGSNLQFSAERDELHFARATLELPHVAADSSLRELLESHARTLLDKLPELPTTACRVRRVLSESLRDGHYELEFVARRSGVSARTLQRRLRDEGTSFDELLDDVRKQLALRYLRDAELGIDDAALLLGFSESRAFHRAFLRWTGVTPGKYRRQSS